MARVGRYKASCNGDEAAAMAAYLYNILLSEALTPVLAVVEIALRNAVHRELTRHYSRDDWWNEWRTSPRFRSQVADISVVSARLGARRQPRSPDKIVAELTFGFWATLFNAEFQDELWSVLRKAFPHCPKAKRKRATISSVVNRMRTLRNRVFHHEPIIWQRYDAESIHQEGLELLRWLHGDINSWVERMDRVPEVWDRWTCLRSAARRSG